jgi:pyruvate/2-oxoglutarate dehydrogenase complex dihydrolipoamide acyltransferase (E2) component
VLSEILVPDGTTVPVGTELARIGGTPAIKNDGGSRAQLRSPVVRRLAREHHIDLSAVHGSGAGGRVTRDDVLALVKPAIPQVPLQPQPQPESGSRTVPFSPLRARIAANVLASKRMVADVFSVIEADMETVHAARTAAGFTYLPFIARAVVEALRAFPAVNGRLDGTSLVYNADVNLGIAVDLDEAGLVVPVIRNADGLTVTGLARAIAALSANARASKLGAADYAGSTFTITNNGSYGTLMTAPIINTPNVATLSTDAVEERVVPHEGGIAIRRRMYLCMSWDHQAFDGSTAGKFIARIKRELEHRDWTTQL